MRTSIDIRPLTERKPRSTTTSGLLAIHLQSGWVAFRVGSKNGWYVFNRITKKGGLGKRWYVGFSMTFDKAISKARALSGRKIPVNTGSQWKRIDVKHYNFTNICDATILNLIIHQIKK